MVEHLTRNEKVVGSIPTISSKQKDTLWRVFLFGFRAAARRRVPRGEGVDFIVDALENR